MLRIVLLTAAILVVQTPPPGSQPGVRAFTGLTLIDGTGGPAIADAVLIVRDRKIVAAGPAATTRVPEGAERVDLPGRFVMPGIINAHGHVGATVGLENRADGYTPENLLRQVRLYAKYGVTSVVSLGDDGDAGLRLRDENGSPDLNRSRLYVAGPIITAKTPEDARAAVDAAAKLKPDWIKIRVDDNLGTSQKMRPEVYRAVIEQAHAHKLRVAAHLFYLADAKDLLRAGVDYIAHSVRDAPVDRELIDLMKARNVCLCPTLMREVSTFVYESTPSWVNDPFFRRGYGADIVAEASDTGRQAKFKASPGFASGQKYKAGLEVAKANLKKVQDAGIRVAFGTDTGPAGRFQGFFEHLELEMMVQSGLTPMQAIVSATGNAAACWDKQGVIGTIAKGAQADLLVLARNPLENITNTRAIDAIYIGGRRFDPPTP
jgi:imidazolonepropionase-like amidohydrolase